MSTKNIGQLRVYPQQLVVGGNQPHHAQQHWNTFVKVSVFVFQGPLKIIQSLQVSKWNDLLAKSEM